MDTPVYEVFGQRDALTGATWVGSLRAATPDLALEMAREAFFRREGAFDIWVVPAAMVTRAREVPAILPVSPRDKTYRLPSGYDNAPAWKRFRAEAQTIEEVAEEMSPPRRTGS